MHSVNARLAFLTACAAQLLLWRAGEAAPALAPGDAQRLQPLSKAEGLEGDDGDDAAGWLAGAADGCCSD